MAIHLRIEQLNQGQYPQEFIKITRCNEKNQSFYVSLGFAILSSICRLKVTAHFLETYNNLHQKLTGLQYQQGIKLNHLENFYYKLQYAGQTEIDPYIDWLLQQNMDFMAYSMRAVVKLILHHSSHQETNKIMDMRTVPHNYREILKLVAESLNFGIYFIEIGGNPQIFEGSSDSKPIIFIGKHKDEYHVLYHKDYQTNTNFESYPYVYKRSSVQIISPSINPIEKNNSNPAEVQLNNEKDKKIQELENDKATLHQQNLSLQQELKRLKDTLNHLSDDPNFKKINLNKILSAESSEKCYDGVIVIDNFKDIMNPNKCWTIELKSPKVCENIFDQIEETVAFVTVTGAYDKGKTFLLNKICNLNFLSGKRHETKGISFKNHNFYGVDMTIIDSAGTHSPIKMNETIGDKKETEKRLRDIIFLLSDFFILVVNDYTTVDQEILEKLEKQLKGNKNKLNKEIIVVHNLKDIYDENDKNYIWQKQIESLYPQSENKTSKNKNQEEEKNQKNVNQSRHDTEKRALTLIQNVSDFQLSYLKTDNSRHVLMINDNSEYGNKYNNAVIEMISGWMKTCCTSNRKKNIYKKFFKILSRNLNSSQSDSNYPTPFNGQSPLYNYKGLLVFEDRDDNTKLKLFCNDTNITNSISVLPNNYIPPIDILESPTEFIILIDIPGDVEYEIINEKNRVKFILKRSEEYKELFGSRERASGESYQEFKIPAQYNPENPVDTLENGVLKVIFKARQKYGKKGGSAAIKK